MLPRMNNCAEQQGLLVWMLHCIWQCQVKCVIWATSFIYSRLIRLWVCLTTELMILHYGLHVSEGFWHFFIWSCLTELLLSCYCMYPIILLKIGKRPSDVFSSLQQSSFGEPVPTLPSDPCFWLTGVEPDVIFCFCISSTQGLACNIISHVFIDLALYTSVKN